MEPEGPKGNIPETLDILNFYKQRAHLLRITNEIEFWDRLDTSPDYIFSFKYMKHVRYIMGLNPSYRKIDRDARKLLEDLYESFLECCISMDLLEEDRYRALNRRYPEKKSLPHYEDIIDNVQQESTNISDKKLFQVYFDVYESLREQVYLLRDDLRNMALELLYRAGKFK